MLHQLLVDMSVHFRDIPANLRQSREAVAITGQGYAIAQIARACSALLTMVPGTFIVSLVVAWMNWHTPTAALVAAGSVLATGSMALVVPLHLRILRLKTGTPGIEPILRRMALAFNAIALLSSCGWSLMNIGILASDDPTLSSLAIPVAISTISIGALGYFSLPATNLIWLLSNALGLCAGLLWTGTQVTPFFYLLLVAFIFLVWRSAMVIWSHYTHAIVQAHELAQAREREFEVEQAQTQQQAEQELEAQRMLAAQRDRYVEEQRRAMAELAKAFDRSVMHTIDSLGTALTQLGVCASALHEIGEETDYSAAQVNARAANVGQSVQNVSGAAAQLSQSAQLIVQRVEDQHLAATAARSSSLEGSEAVGALAQQAAKVSQIATLIQDIASQTNLLALNATIEAARAGEAGRGFAVVAQEVKQLAGQTRGAINSVGQTVDGIRTRMTLAENTIDSIADQIDLVSEGAAHIAKVIGEQREATLGINTHAHQVANDARSMEDTARTVSHNAVRVKSMSDDIRALTARLEDQASALRMASAEFLAELKAG